MRDVSHAGIPPGSRSRRALTLSLFLPPEGGTPGSALYLGVGRGEPRYINGRRFFVAVPAGQIFGGIIQSKSLSGEHGAARIVGVTKFRFRYIHPPRTSLSNSRQTFSQ
jgi:hypothetical protein